MKNNGNGYSRVTIKSALFPATKNVDRLSSYPIDDIDGLNFDGVTYPTPLKEWDKIEKQNNIAVNVYGWEKGKVVIYKISKREETPINILLYNEHYVLIKNLDKLLNEGDKHSSYHCGRCLQGFQTKEKLTSHKENCNGVGGTAVRIEMSKNKYIKFENHKNQLEVPYIIIADFEAILEKIDACESDPKKSSTTKTSLHEPCGFCYTVVRSDEETEKPVLQRA